jgi:intein/homing endonuclease
MSHHLLDYKSDESILYIAGLFDGEGCISYIKPERNRQARYYITIYNTHQEVMERIHGLYPNSTISDRKRKDKWKRCWQVSFSSKLSVVEFLTDVTPYLIIKREKAEKALAHMEQYKTLSNILKYNYATGKLIFNRDKKGRITNVCKTY